MESFLVCSIYQRADVLFAALMTESAVSSEYDHSTDTVSAGAKSLSSRGACPGRGGGGGVWRDSGKLSHHRLAFHLLRFRDLRLERWNAR